MKRSLTEKRGHRDTEVPVKREAKVGAEQPQVSGHKEAAEAERGREDPPLGQLERVALPKHDWDWRLWRWENKHLFF